MLKRYASVIYSVAITSGLFLLLYALSGFYPFGEELVSWCDMNQQTIPLINTFKDIFSEGSGLFQNFRHAGGMNLYGVFFFFVSSPFNILTLFVDKADIPQFMNILVMLKLSCAAGVAGYFFSKRYPSLNTLIKTALSVSYAFCGYGMLFYQNIIWLDIMILFPLILLACHILLEKGRVLPLIAALTACVVINYYISFMVILFLILFFGMKGLFKKTSSDTFVKLGIGVVSALLLSAVVWVPSLIQYFSSARGNGLISGLQSASFFTSYQTAIPVVLCSALTFSVVMFAAASGRLKLHKDRFFTILLLLIPLIIEPVNMMWHTGNYMSFPARFAFITVFLLCELCAEVINDVDSVQKSNKWFAALSVSLAAVSGGFLLWYTNRNFDTLSIYTRTLWGNSQSFEGIFGAFTVAFAVFAVIFGLLRYKKISKGVFAAAISVLLIYECVCSTQIYVISAKGSFDNQNYQNVLESTKDLTDDSFYFTKLDKKYTDANQLGGFSVNTLGHYTSLNSASFMEGAKMLGYSGYWMEINSSGGSILSDALLNIKYTLKRDHNGEYFFEKNEVFPHIIYSDTPFPETLSGDRLTSLNNAIKGATGVELVSKYLSSEGVEHRFGNELYENEVIHYTVQVSEPTALYFDCYNGFSNALTEPINEAVTVYADSLFITGNYPSQNSNGLLYLGEYQNTTVDISVKMNRNICASSFGVFGINKTLFNEVLQGIKGDTLTQNGGELLGSVQKDAPRYAFLGIPYKEGMRVLIGGEEVDVKKALTGFVTFDTEGLSGEIEITYVPKGFYAGILLTLLGVAAVLLIVLFKNSYPPVLHKTATVMFNILFIIFILAVYILPVIINMSA
ncbi:MAG: YfhO family protein [Clostridia bacterium]|nr:YfhO family protein [Clostridia bacterium]